MFLQESNQPALVFNDYQLTYYQLLAAINNYSELIGQYEHTHDTQNQHIVIFAENRAQWVFSFYAAWKQKAVVIPIDFMASSGDVAYIINDCQPDIIIYSEQTKDTLENALGSISDKFNKYHKLNLDKLDYDPKALENTAHGNQFPEPDLSQTALIIYTSGTTGNPKGVMLSYDNLLANIESVTIENPIYNQNDRVMVLLPLHHIFPLLGSMVAPLSVGGRMVFCPSMASEDLMATLQNHQITMVIGVPRLYKLISDSIKAKIQSNPIAKTLFALAGVVNKPGFSQALFKSVQKKFGGHIRYLISGGAKLDEEVATIMRTLGFEVLEGYGMTEAAPMITFTRPGEVMIGSAGKPMSCNEVKSIDGEIVARGRNIMQGYYKLPEATNETIVEGWLHTGDLGYLDKNNNIFITGRKKEIIVLPNGKNISPVEIEQKLHSMSDAIAEVGVYSHKDMLQVVIYPNFVKLKQLQIKEVENYFREQLIAPYNEVASPYKKLMRLHILREELPKTRLGKIKRFMLHTLEEISQYQQHQQQEDPDIESYRAIQTFLSEHLNKDVFPNAHFELDIGMDSLDKVSFQTFLNNTFGVEINEQTFLNYPTVAKIAHYVEETKQHVKVSVVEWAEILKEQVELKLPKSWVLHNPIRIFAGLILKSYFNLTAKGMEKLPQGPCIMAPNHQSFLDGLFITTFLSNHLTKNSFFFAKAKHVNNKLLKFLAHNNNIIVVNIEEDLKTSIQKLSNVLNKGKNIIIFPEGTRTKTGQLGDFKKTYTILSKELNIPIVPIAINGAYHALPKGSLLPRFRQSIEVSFLNPIHPGEENYEQLNSRVREQVAGALAN